MNKLIVVAIALSHTAIVAAYDPSFVVHSFQGGPDPDRFAQLCQRHRAELNEKWFCESSCEAWSPCCEIVLHAGRASFSKAIGPAGFRSFGSTVVRSMNNQVVRRRIDLLTDGHGEFPALLHELAHVVLADRFPNAKPPLWASEGIATMGDSVSKRTLHHRDCLHALQSGTSIRLVELLNTDRFHSPQQVAAFYGQSLSLIEYLVHYEDCSKLILFLQTATDSGYDQALRDVYQIHDVGELERRWKEQITRTAGGS